MTKPVRVKITGDSRDLERALKRSGGALSGFGTTALGVFGGTLLTRGFDALVGGLQSAAGFAIDGVEKLDAMGDAVARLEAQAKGLGDAVTGVDLSRWGVDKGEAAGAALAIASTAKSLGLTQKELRTVVPGMTEYAAQLASLGDGDPEKTAKLLAGALKGSSKAAAQLGVELPKGAKGLAAWEAITAQLGPQLDEATSGTASLADVGDRWDATLANLQLKLAGFLDQLAPVAMTLLDQLLPAFDRMVAVVGPAVSAVFGQLAKTFAGFVEGGGASRVASVFATIADVAGRLGGFLVNRVVPVVVELGGALLEALAPALAEVSKLWDAWMPVLETVWGFVEDVVVPILKTYVLPAIGKLLELVLKVAGAMGRTLGGALRGLSSGFQKLLEWARPVIDALRTIASFGGDVLGNIGRAVGFSLEPSGPAIPGRGALAVNVYAGVGDPVAIGREVSRVLGAYSSRSGHA